MSDECPVAMPASTPWRPQASVAVHLLGVFVAAVLLTAALVAVNVVGDFRDARKAAQQHVTQEAQSQARELSLFLAGGYPSPLAALTENPGLQAARAADCQPVLAQLVQQLPGSGAALVLEDGTTICRAGSYYPATSASWVFDAFNKGAGHEGPLRINGGSRAILGFSISVGTLRGAAALVLEQPSAGALLHPAPSHVSLMVVDRLSGMVLDGWPKTTRVGSFTPQLRIPGQDDPVTSVVPIRSSTWVVVAGVPRSTALASATAGLHRNLLFGTLLLVVLLGLGFVVYRQIARPARRLRRAMDDLANAEIVDTATQRVPEAGPRELAMLGQAFNEMADARARSETRLAHGALHDALTDLPNRTLVLDRLTHLLNRTGRTGEVSAVLFLDLDRFKLVNDSSGHAAGDDLLVQVSERLGAITRPGDTLGRFGGDEFVLVCEALPNPAGAVGVAQRLLAALQPPFRISGQEVFISASVGIAIAQPGDEAGDLLRDADAALYRAKEDGRAGYAVFDDDMRAQVRRRLDIGNKLRHAVNGNGLSIDYQPVIDLTTGSPAGVEALLRYRGPNEELGPDEFIPIAEETGLIVPIGEWVLRESCRQLKQWQSMAGCPADLHVAVNVSARQLAQPDFVDVVARAIDESGLSSGCLTLEVTESVLMGDHEEVALTMRKLRSRGASISIDDFGTGFSSLGYLERLPVDELKVDRSFVAPLARRGRSRAIVESVVDLAHAVGLTVVAEGVEDAEQGAVLASIGCDVAQGFHFARPLAPDAAFDFLRRQSFPTPRRNETLRHLGPVSPQI